MMRRTSCRPTGSSAEVGSSSTTSSGRPSSATPSPRRCCIPFENVSVRSSARSVRPTSSSASRISRPQSARGRWASSQWRREHLARRHPALVAEQLGQVADPAPRRDVAERRPQHAPLAGSRARQAEQQLDGRRLAGAVRAQEAEDLAARHGHRQPGQGDDPPEFLAQLASLDGGFVGSGGPRRTRGVPDRRAAHARPTRRSARRSWRSPGPRRCTSWPARSGRPCGAGRGPGS